MATELLRPHNVLLTPQRIRATPRKPNAGATRMPPAAASTASRRHHGRPSSSSYSAKKTAAALRPAVEVYAGPAFSVSPEPSSLPLPQFPFKKAATVAVVDDAATRDLRRILLLE